MKGPIFAQPRWLWSQLETARSTLLASDPNRLISFGRFMTVAFAVLAIWLDPTQPYLYHTEVHYLLTFYLGYSALMLLAPSRRRVDSPAHLFSHVFDTVIFGCLALLTNELTSPFFVFLPFTLMAMTMRWGLGAPYWARSFWSSCCMPSAFRTFWTENPKSTFWLFALPSCCSRRSCSAISARTAKAAGRG
ncbi:hypothetical protein [Novosphingobium panipatense]|uniref:hypothetical protein n=1 Tax=Novosphingobium panipatense TaxID=428991 RepID=UPI003612E6C9